MASVEVTEVARDNISDSNYTTRFGGVFSTNGISTNDSVAMIRNETVLALEITILAVMFTVAMLGNSLAVLALTLHRRKLSRMHYFILHLCISDLVVTFFHILPQMVLDIFGGFLGGYPGDRILCKLIKYLQMLGPYSSSYVLAVTAIDRYQAICFPLMNCSWTPRRSKIMVSIAWILSLLLCLPQVFIFDYFYGEYKRYDCYASFAVTWGERFYVLFVAIAIFVIPLFILIYTYFCICRVIVVNYRQKIRSEDINRRHSNPNPASGLKFSNTPNLPFNFGSENAVQMNVTCTSYSFKKKCHVDLKMCRKNSAKKTSTSVCNEYPRTHSVIGISRAKMKTIKLTVIVIVCYICCSMPYFSAMLYATWNPEVRQFAFYSSDVFAILALLVSLNSCVNPWIYLAFNENLAKTLKDLFCCHLHQEKQCTFTVSRSSLYEPKTLAEPNTNHNVTTKAVSHAGPSIAAENAYKANN